MAYSAQRYNLTQIIPAADTALRGQAPAETDPVMVETDEPDADRRLLYDPSPLF